MRDALKRVLYQRVLRTLTAPSQRAKFWERQIRAYEREDRRQPPTPEGIVFTGSSSIRFWKSLAQDMSPLPVLNRGFGGSHMAHVHHYLSRLVLTHSPRIVVLYAGDNDLGLSTRLTADDVTRALDKIHVELVERLPECHLVLLSIKPSKLRRQRWPEMQKVNTYMAQLSETDERVHYVDVATPMMNRDGAVEERYLTWDGLHPNAEGYELFTAQLRPKLEEIWSTG